MYYEFYAESCLVGATEEREEGDEYDTEGGIYFPLSCENCDCRMEHGDTNEYGGMNPVCASCRDELSADETAGE